MARDRLQTFGGSAPEGLYCSLEWRAPPSSHPSFFLLSWLIPAGFHANEDPRCRWNGGKGEWGGGEKWIDGTWRWWSPWLSSTPRFRIGISGSRQRVLTRKIGIFPGKRGGYFRSWIIDPVNGSVMRSLSSVAFIVVVAMRDFCIERERKWRMIGGKWIFLEGWEMRFISNIFHDSAEEKFFKVRQFLPNKF